MEQNKSVFITFVMEQEDLHEGRLSQSGSVRTQGAVHTWSVGMKLPCVARLTASPKNTVLNSNKNLIPLQKALYEKIEDIY
jgi:hypothetical protein